jgi:hypothetical protein
MINKAIEWWRGLSLYEKEVWLNGDEWPPTPRERIQKMEDFYKASKYTFKEISEFANEFLHTQQTEYAKLKGTA